VDNHACLILAHGKTAQAGTQVLIAMTPDVRVGREKIETLSDGINEPVGNPVLPLSVAT
jgi:hypothetical protein